MAVFSWVSIAKKKVVKAKGKYASRSVFGMLYFFRYKLAVNLENLKLAVGRGKAGYKCNSTVLLPQPLRDDACVGVNKPDLAPAQIF